MGAIANHGSIKPHKADQGLTWMPGTCLFAGLNSTQRAAWDETPRHRNGEFDHFGLL